MAFAARAQQINYTVNLDQPQTQTLTVTMRVSDFDRDTLEVSLPVWRPGRYEVLELATTVRSVRARQPGGGDLAIEKTAKSTWRIDTRGVRDVEIISEIYANSLNDRTRHVDDTHAFLDGSAVFMFVDEWRDRPVEVTLNAPSEWRIACGMEFKNGSKNVLVADNYDVLVDSPIEVGLHEKIVFEAAGRPHEIAIWGEAVYDAEELKEEFTKIIESQAEIFGGVPYKRYVFQVHAGPGLGGGTEHLNSTIMQTSSTFGENRASLRGFLGLVAHEYFHTWNVKQFRPAGIHPYDYLRENYTTQLWIAEGSTSYYDDLTLARIGVTTTRDYLSGIAGSYSSISQSPGARLQSLEASSFDAWVKFNKNWQDKSNTTVSFYTKGALVSLMLDMEIRGRTQNAHSLDTVMRLLYERFPLSGPGYTEEDFAGIVEELVGSDMSSFFRAFVSGTSPLTLDAAMRVVGLELTTEKADKNKPDSLPYLGLSLRGEEGLSVVTTVQSDGPAFVGGIRPGDAVLAVNGKRVRGTSLDAALKDVAASDAVMLSIFRGDRLLEIELKTGSKPNRRYVIEHMEAPTALQKQTYRSWIGQPWPGDKDEAQDEEGASEEKP